MKIFKKMLHQCESIMQAIQWMKVKYIGDGIRVSKLRVNFHFWATNAQQKDV